MGAPESMPIPPKAERGGVVKRSIRAFVAALTVSAGLIALTASSAFAANGYVCQISGSGVASPSECNGSGNSIPGGGLTSPAGLTTDSAGNLWVSDGANPPIDKFDPNGNFLAQGTGEGNWSGGIGAIAFNGQSGKLDVSDGIKLWELNPDGSYVDQLAFQGMQYGPRIAVDASGESTNGDLYFSYFN